MLAYHNDPAIKSATIDRLATARKENRLILEVVGKRIGIPEVLGYPLDAIYEGLNETGDTDLAVAWPERFFAAIPVGADLSMVWPKWALWMLDQLDSRGNERVAAAIKGVQDLYAEWVETGVMPAIKRLSAAAERAGRTAAATDAAAAAAAAAAWAADAAADAADAAADAVVAAADAADEAAVRAYWRRAADELIRLLADAKGDA